VVVVSPGTLLVVELVVDVDGLVVVVVDGSTVVLDDGGTDVVEVGSTVLGA